MTILREDVMHQHPDLDCREMDRDNPACRDFLYCQIGRWGINGHGEPIFHLMGFGRSWEAALHTLKNRRK